MKQSLKIFSLLLVVEAIKSQIEGSNSGNTSPDYSPSGIFSPGISPPSRQCFAPCNNDYKPVCGMDGVTYLNSCYLICNSNTEIMSEGPCNNYCNCLRIFKPACGLDGQNYYNRCFARCFDVPINHSGVCTPCQCGNSLEPVCGIDGKTYRNSCMASCQHVEVAYDSACYNSQCICEQIYKPVCGMNGVTYNNTCEADCKHIQIAHNGSCGIQLAAALESIDLYAI